MELIFIRHGQGEHTVKPDGLQILHPCLTSMGKKQAEMLQSVWPLSSEDVIIVSPTLRTLQTMDVWSGDVDCQKTASSSIGPRMFPQNNGAETLPCDFTMSKHQVMEKFPEIKLHGDRWGEEGINRISHEDFTLIANEWVEWCKQQGKKRLFIVTHDGTMTAYRQWLENRPYTRNDFPGDAGWIKVEIG